MKMPRVIEPANMADKVEMILCDLEQFVPGAEEGEGLAEFVVEFFMQATTDWDKDDYRDELFSLTAQLQAYIHSVKSEALWAAQDAADTEKANNPQ